MAWHVAPSTRRGRGTRCQREQREENKGRRKSTQTLRTRMDSGPHSSMQSGPATGGTSRRGRGSRVVLARVDPNRSEWGKAQPTGCGRAWRPLARRMGHDCAHARFSGRKSAISEIGMCAPQKCAARLRCCPGNGGMGGRGHLQQEFSMQTIFWCCSDRKWDDLRRLSRQGQPSGDAGTL